MAFIIAIYLAALLLKISGASFMEDVKWWHFLVFPLVFMLLYALFQACRWLGSFVIVILSLDCILWLVNATMGWGGHDTLFVWQLIVLTWDAIFY